jgi:hypothetical protein
VNKPYWGSGTALRKYPDGREERVSWASVQFETRDRCYHARRYANGEVAFAINCETVDALPNTPGVKRLLNDFQSAKFAEYLAQRVA